MLEKLKKEVKKLKEKLQKFSRVDGFWMILILVGFIPLLWFKGNLVIAGGDNTHNYLDFGRKYATLTTWDDTVNLGSPSRHLHNLILPLAANLLNFIPDYLLQRILFCFLFFCRLATFYLLLKTLFPNQTRKIIFLPSVLLFALNPFFLTDLISSSSFLVPIQMTLLFLLVYKIVTDNKIDIRFLLLIALTNSCLFSNPPSMIVTYLPAGLYLIFAIGKRRRSGFKIFTQTLLAAVLFLALSLWYLIPSFMALLEASKNSSVPNYSEIVNSGKFWDHLRLIGQWGWYEKYYLSDYVPFAKNYDRLPLLLTTYGVTLFSFLSVFLLRKRKIFLFALGLFLLGLILANGGKPPLGNIYLAIYKSHPFFLMFREPWTKFTPLQVFALPLLLYGALTFLQQRLNSRLASGVCFAVSLVVLINVYPVFTGEGIWHQWNGSMRSFQVAVPAYWHELKQYLIANNLQDERIITLPAARYGMAYNWEHGISTPEDVAASLLPNPILGFSSFPTQRANQVINQFYNSFRSDNFTPYLRLLNTGYLLQENDVDWRYSPNETPPAKLTEFLAQQKLSVVETFGQFDQKLLSEIPNKEPDEIKRQAFSQELSGKPALILYKLANIDPLPKFYVPEEIISSPNGPEILPTALSFKDNSPQAAFYLQNTNPSQSGKIFVLAEKIEPQAGCANSCYHLSIPQAGEYEILVAKEELQAGGLKASLEIGNQKLLPLPLSDDNPWISYGKLAITSGVYQPSLNLPTQKNALDDKNWLQVKITKDQKLTYPEPLIYQEIKNWSQADFFTISFEYQARYGKLGLVILEDLEEVFKVELESKDKPEDWATFQKIISPHAGKKAAICFYYLPDNPSLSTKGDGNFRDVKATPLFQPTLILRHQPNEKKPSLATPQITFTKIRPTKYELQVTEAKDPYLLVFSENFHPDWALHLNGSGKPLAKDRHLIINGYANAWYVSPEDVGRQQNYTLIAEFGWQKYLLWGAIISGVTLVGCLVYLLGNLYRRPKPYF